MTLRSIDMQVLLPKIAEVHRNQPVQNQNDGSQQQQFALQMQREVKQNRQQVQTSNKSEGSIVKDGHGNNQPSDQQNEREKKDETEKESVIEAKDPARGSLLDIKI